jgi:hypothetical protein
MKLEDIKYLDSKIKKYEGIEGIFNNNDNSVIVEIINSVEEKIDDKIMKNKSCEKEFKNE